MKSKLSYKSIFAILIILLSILPIISRAQDTLITNYPLKEELKHPYGTIMKMKVEIINGNSLKMKYYLGKYLFKIIKLNDEILEKPIIIEFRDETERFSRNDFELYEHLYGKNTGSLSSGKIEEMQANYVGKVFNIVAYESGEFNGDPDGYSNYQPIRQNIGFNFIHYVIVIADLTEEN